MNICGGRTHQGVNVGIPPSDDVTTMGDDGVTRSAWSALNIKILEWIPTGRTINVNLDTNLDDPTNW